MVTTIVTNHVYNYYNTYITTKYKQQSKNVPRNKKKYYTIYDNYS